MKKLLLVLLLSLSCFGQNQKIDEYLNNIPYLKTVKEINVWHRSIDNPGVFILEVTMYNKSGELVSFEIYKEFSQPIGFATFKITKENGLRLKFDNEIKVDKMLSEEGQFKMIFNLFNNIENKITYIYNKGE